MTYSDRSFHDAVFVDGCRLPFLRSGTAYADLTAYDLGRMVIKGLVNRIPIEAGEIDRVILGCVVQDVNTTNVAREAALAAGIPERVPAFTVTMACISSNQAIASGVDLIRTGQAQAVLAGGTETLSDMPIRLSKRLRKKLMESRKLKSASDYLSLLKDLRPKDIIPEVPSITEYSTGETMGESADKLAAAFGVTRAQQDAFALRSHHKAAEAWKRGAFDAEVIPAHVPPDFEPIVQDNGVRPDTSIEKLEKLSPVFVRPYGTVTAGNASYLTDGASAVLLMQREAAQERGIRARAVLREYVVVAQDPDEELLLGPAYAIPRLLEQSGLALHEVDVFELHEAFAGQVLAVLRALESEQFARDRLGRNSPVGVIPMDRLNLNGGSLSIGHPFGATGARLVTTAVNRLHAENGRYALVAACAAGGLGHAMIIEREASA